MKRWQIVYSVYSRAVEELAAAVQPYLNYPLPCAQTADEAYNPIYLRREGEGEGYRLFVSESDGERQYVELAAADDVQLRYAVADFANRYLPFARDADTHVGPYYFNDLFNRPLKPFQYETKPHIRQRGLWTWGHCIYDYRRYIDHMVQLKLNTLIVWNDHLPVNIHEVLDYAHESGVRLYLGFAWGWDTSVPDITRPEEMAAAIMQTYEAQYAAVPCDGIYFQSFTEHSRDVIDGVVVAQAVVDLVNTVGGRLLDKHPRLHLLFGLHATSVTSRLDIIAQVDPRITVMWEDVGAFPYHYLPSHVAGFEQTAALHDTLQSLRGGGFGAVLKGLTCLDWTAFEHQPAPFAMGVADRAFLQKRAAEKREILRFIQAYWIRNARYAHALIRQCRPDAMITCLMEDGLFEEAINYPVALYAQMLWDSDPAAEDILCETAQRPDVHFV